MRELAEKHGVSYDQMRKHAAKRGMEAKAHKHNTECTQKIVQKVLEQITTQEADRIVRILSAGDKLLSRPEEATDQLTTPNHPRPQKNV